MWFARRSLKKVGMLDVSNGHIDMDMNPMIGHPKGLLRDIEAHLG